MFRVLSIAAAAASIIPVTASAQQVGSGDTIYIACQQMGELARGLDQVVNEMQLYNNSRDIWRSSRGCVERNPYNVNIDSVRFMGWYRTQPRDSDDPQFWVPIYSVEYIPRRESREIIPGVTISEETLMFRPDGAFRVDRWRLPRGCEREWAERPERYGRVRLYGTDRQGGLPYCLEIDYVGRDFRESRRR